MLRAAATALALAGLCTFAFAASEADRRDCASHQSADAKIAACTRVIEDPGEAPASRTLAYRTRGNAYGNRKLHALANLDFAEALKLSPQDQPSLFGRGVSFLNMGQYDRAIADLTQFLEVNPRGVRAFNERGLAQAAQRRYRSGTGRFRERAENQSVIRARSKQSGACVCEARQLRGGDRRIWRDYPHGAQIHSRLLEPRPSL